MYEPPMFQHADPSMRQEVRRFKADVLTEDNRDDLAAWSGSAPTDTGITLPSGVEVPFGQRVVCQDGRYLKVDPAEFDSSFVPA